MCVTPNARDIHSLPVCVNAAMWECYKILGSNHRGLNTHNCTVLGGCNQALENVWHHNFHPSPGNDSCISSFFCSCLFLLLGKYWKSWVCKVNVGLQGQQVSAFKKKTNWFKVLFWPQWKQGSGKQMIKTKREIINSASPTQCFAFLLSKSYELARFSPSRYPKLLQKTGNGRKGPKCILSAH